MPDTLIITHPGSAHFDEFFAISLILSTHEDQCFQVVRREPLEEELNNPQIWVVDVGNRHEPLLKNFDHHQDLETPASFRIVAEHLGLSETLSLLPWWDYKDKIDRFGPIRVGAEMGARNLSITYSPFEEWYLDCFAETPSDSLPLMKAFGQSMVTSAERLLSGINYWKNAERLQVKQKVCLLGRINDLTGAEEYLTRLGGPPYSITISHDRRGEGWTLKRYHEDPDINFARLKNHPDVKFTHPGGFIAKTITRLPIETLKELIATSVV